MPNIAQEDVETAATANPDKAGKQQRVRRMAGSPVPCEAQPSDNTGLEASPPPATPLRSPSKIASVLALLEQADGATLAEMVEATHWLPHTTRAALTGLKKKGHLITKGKR
jgi:hypothetical protein